MAWQHLEKQVSVPRHNPALDLVAAFVLLTRLPLPWDRLTDTAPNLNRSVWAFPVVGVLVGGCGGIGYGAALMLGLPPMVSALLAVTVMILLTGAFHEDGLADVADGFGGGLTLDRKLQIMRDSRIGAYGMLAIIIAVGLRVFSLASFSFPHAVEVLIIAAMFSRLMMAFIMRALPPARNDGLAHDTGKPGLLSIGVGIAITFGITFALTNLQLTISICGVAIVSCLIIGWIAKRQINGFTGDVLGAAQQVTEISVLLFLLTNLKAG